MADTIFDEDAFRAGLAEFHAANRSLVDSELARLFDREPTPQEPEPLPPSLSADALLRWYAANKRLVDSELDRLFFDREPFGV
jgi:hypothetical protein